MSITEGVDRVCPHCGGIERRAFGLDLEPGQRAERRKLLGGWKRGDY